MLVVKDTVAGAEWYQRVLDATLHNDPGPGDSAILDVLGHWLLLVVAGEPDEGKPTVTLAPPTDADRPSAQLVFRVDDCTALHQLLSARGADFLAPPHVRDGETRAFFRDPDGHLLEISELT